MKKIIALLLTLTMMLGLSVPAFAAANETSGSMAVTYNVESSYVINLPDITLTEGSTTFDITADYVHIASNKKLTVSIDPDQTLTNGKFYLFKDGGTDLNTAMECTVYVSNSGTSKVFDPYYLSSTDLYAIAMFYPGDTTATEYGRLTLTPNVTASNTYGTYTGNIYYIISIS